MLLNCLGNTNIPHSQAGEKPSSQSGFPSFQYFFLTVWDSLTYINLPMFVSLLRTQWGQEDYGSLFSHCGKTYLDSNVPSPISFSSILSNVYSILSLDSPDHFFFPLPVQSSTESMEHMYTRGGFMSM